MLFSYNWLKNLIKGKLPNPEKLAELLTTHSFEVEEVKKVGSDFVLNIDVLPNRGPDCLNHRGMAREIAVILGKKLKILEKEKLKSVQGKIKPINLKIRCSQLVPRYSAIVIEGVKVGPSPQWLKKWLKTLGIRSINNVVDLTNFVMFETGQPLHAFDYDKIKEQKIVLRLSKKGEKVTTLDDKKHTLDAGMLVIEDRGRIIDLVGIMGGKLSEVDSRTKNIVLQAGNFDRWAIYKTAKKLTCLTEAANIYIHGIDPNLTIPVLEKAYFLLKKLGGGKIVQVIDIYPKKVLPKRIKLDLDYVEKLLGVKIPKSEIKNIFKRLEFKIIEVKPQYMIVETPTRRLDITLPENLIEEIGRITGLKKIPSTFPQVALIPPKRNPNIFWENLCKNILKEAGFSEVYNRSFIGKNEAKIFRGMKAILVEVENPTSADYQYLRPSLILNLLKNVRKNQKNFDEIRIFEVGKTFKIGKGKQQKSNYEEKRMLTGVMTGDSFYQMKGIIDLLLNKLGISNVWYDQYQPTPEDSKTSLWHPKICAEIKIDNEEIGFLGEVSPSLLKALKIKGKLAIFDLDFEKLTKLASEEHEYMPISPYPAAIRDLAVLVPREIRVVEVLNKINTAGGKIIRDVDLFDIYEGKELPRGKKNLAFHLIYQAEDRTLSSKEIDKIQEKIIKALEQNPDWQVRK